MTNKPLLQDPTTSDSPTSTYDKLMAIYGPDDATRILKHVPDMSALATQIDELREQGKPLQVALFWGPHPDVARNKPNKADRRTLNSINLMFDGIIDTKTTIILADYHGRVNGIENTPYLNGIADYIKSLDDPEAGKRIRAISLDGLYERYHIPEPELGTIDKSDEELLKLLEVSAANHPTRTLAENYLRMRRNELPAVERILSPEGDGVLLVITDPDTMEVSKDLENTPVVIRAENKSGINKSNRPPWVPHSGASLTTTQQIAPSGVSSTTAGAPATITRGL